MLNGASSASERKDDAPFQQPQHRQSIGMSIRIGLSGWGYEPWSGSYYPPNLPKSQWLAFVSRDFATVEVNRSFYSLLRRSIGSRDLQICRRRQQIHHSSERASGSRRTTRQLRRVGCPRVKRQTRHMSVATATQPQDRTGSHRGIPGAVAWLPRPGRRTGDRPRPSGIWLRATGLTFGAPTTADTEIALSTTGRTESQNSRSMATCSFISTTTGTLTQRAMRSPWLKGLPPEKRLSSTLPFHLLSLGYLEAAPTKEAP